MRSARTPRAIRWGVVSEPKVTGTIIDGAPARLSCLYPADRLNSTPGQSSKGGTHARARRTENESGAAPHPAGGRPSGVGGGGTLAGGRHPVRHTSGSRTLSMVRRNPRRGPSAESAHAGLGAQVDLSRRRSTARGSTAANQRRLASSPWRSSEELVGRANITASRHQPERAQPTRGIPEGSAAGFVVGRRSELAQRDAARIFFGHAPQGLPFRPRQMPEPPVEQLSARR